MRKLKTSAKKPKPRDLAMKRMIQQKNKSGAHTDRKKQANKDACNIGGLTEDGLCSGCEDEGKKGGCVICGKLAKPKCPDCIYDEDGVLMDKCAVCIVEGLSADVEVDDEDYDRRDTRDIWDED